MSLERREYPELIGSSLLQELIFFLHTVHGDWCGVLRGIAASEAVGGNKWCAAWLREGERLLYYCSPFFVFLSSNLREFPIQIECQVHYTHMCAEKFVPYLSMTLEMCSRW